MHAKLAVVSVLAFFAQRAFADCARSYTIQEGDWCDTISASKNVSTYQLAVVNPDINEGCTNLMPGKSICLGNKNEDCSTTYVVQANDRCEQIIANHGLNSTIFDLNNPQINEACDNIYIGEVLCVSGSVQVPPRPAGDLPASTIPPGATPAVPAAASSAALVKPSSSPLAVPASTLIAVPTSSFVGASTSTLIAPTPTPTSDDDEDCDDEDDGDDSNTGSGNSQDDDEDCDDEDTGDDADDEDLPFCDEI